MSELLDYSWLREHTALYLRDPERAHDWDAMPVGGTGLVPTLLLTGTGTAAGTLPSPTTATGRPKTSAHSELPPLLQLEL